MKILLSGCCVIMLFLSAITGIYAQDITETIEINSNRIQVAGLISEAFEYPDRAFISGNYNRIQLNNNTAIDRNHLSEIVFSPLQISSWNPQLNGNVEAMAPYRENLIVGGHFTSFNNSPRTYLASFNIQNKQLTDLNVNINGPVYALVVHENTLYAGGGFSEINGGERRHIASIDLTSNQLTQWNPDINDNVFAMAQDGSTLYIGGSFTQINGEKRERVAAFDASTGKLLSWSPEVKIIVTSMTAENGKVTITGYIEEKNQRIDQEVVVEQETGRIVSQNSTTLTATPTPDPVSRMGDPQESTVAGLMVDQEILGFAIPTLSDILTFIIRGFFVIAGLAALFYMLLGAFAWVTSGGDKDSVQAARDKIQSAVVGVLMIVVVLAVVWTLEQVIFRRTICFGISCPVTIPSLIQPT